MSIPRKIRDIANTLVVDSIENKSVVSMIKDIKSVNSTFKQSKNLAIDLQNQNVPFELRQNALFDSLKDEVDGFLIKALLELQRLRLLEDIEQFTSIVIELARIKADHYDATVYSTVELTASDTKQIEKIMQNKFKGTISLDKKIDNSILGGLIIETGDWRFDASLKGQINQLKEHLSA